MKKLLSLFITLCMCLSVGVVFTACKKEKPTETSINYTVTEEQWKMNFNLTKSQSQAQTLSCSTIGQRQAQLLSNTSTGITSYTVYAEGENDGVSGTSLLKVAPNAMSIEFYIGDTLREDESGTFASSTDFYQGLTTSILSYFPFTNYYDEFSFDQTKNAYVCENLTSTMNDEYDVNDIYYVYTKSAEVTFVNGYLNTITVELCDETFEDSYAFFEFTFSDINNTTVEI